jgi:hypothetical protein
LPGKAVSSVGPAHPLKRWTTRKSYNRTAGGTQPLADRGATVHADVGRERRRENTVENTGMSRGELWRMFGWTRS